jgi:hypothetical protein
MRRGQSEQRAGIGACSAIAICKDEDVGQES